MTPLYWALAKVAVVAVLAGVAYLLRRQLAGVARAAGAEVRKRPLVWGIAAALVGGVLAAWLLPIWQLASRAGSLAPDRYLELQNAYRATIVQALAGVALLVTIYLTWRRVAATEQQVEVAREGQITERFTRAIEHLGSDKLEVRLGGIYALERIARDSEKDHWPIMEVLTAYVRQRSPLPEEGPGDVGPPRTVPVMPDIQAILTVIGRRRVKYDPPGQRLDLTRTDLSFSTLVRAKLSMANLYGAYMVGALLVEARLDAARLGHANLSHATMRKATLCSAELPEANLMSARLQGADLSHADLTLANLRKAELGGASLREADLTGAKLHETDPLRVDASPARFSETDLSGADLSKADLRAVDLSGAKGLTREQLAQAITDERTSLPGYLKQRKEEPAQEANEQADGGKGE
jgi:hypothetical protein